MATSVTYKDSQITSFANGTRILKTAGKYMEDDVTIVTETGDASAITIVDEQDSHGGIIRHINAVTLTGDTITADKLLSGYTAHDGSGQAITGTYVPPSGGGTGAISIEDTPDAAGGTVRTVTAVDISDTTAVAADVAQGKYFYTAAGVKTAGAASRDSGATQHTIHLEFSDNTDTDIEVDYNDSWIGSLITSTKPQTYSSKTIDSAALDNTVWYQRTIIPLNTELVDYTQCTADYAIGQDGEAFSQEWSYVSDYIAVDPSMTFSYTNSYWFYIGVYDDAKNVVRAIYAMTDGTVDPNDGNTGHGTLSGNKLLGASFVRLCGASNSSAYMSLIRTA